MAEESAFPPEAREHGRQKLNWPASTAARVGGPLPVDRLPPLEQGEEIG